MLDANIAAARLGLQYPEAAEASHESLAEFGTTWAPHALANDRPPPRGFATDTL